MKHAYLLAFGAACACWPILSHAQTGVLAKDTARNGAVTFMRLDTHATPKPLAGANAVLRTLLKLTPDDELRISKQQQDELGYTHQWHIQYYRGIPVEYGTYVVHARNQVIETINGELIPVKNLKAKPALDEKAALQKALANVNATAYRWQIPTEEQWIKSVKKDVNATFYPKGELLVTHGGENNALIRLAYKFTIYAVKPASSDYVYVDAHTGDVFQKTPIVQHTNSPGTAATRYSQTRTITTDAFAGGYRLRETGRGTGSACGGAGAPIETYNMQSGSSFGAAVDFVSSNNNWVNLNNSAKDDAALDAHWGAESTYDYFNTAHCRNSYDNAGSVIKGYVHTNLPGISLQFSDNDNAFWDPNLKIMVYGDGTRFFSPLTALDVVAHEIGHGYAQHMVGFDQNYPEANALNEGLSDIWGACVEYFVAPNKQTWKIGEDIMQTASCLRNMASPNSGIDPSTRLTVTGGYPDVYNGQYYDSSTGEPHTNSTILSHCFYLLAAGGSGSNSSGTAFNITGVGIGKASDIVFRAENNGYITPTAGFQIARSAMIRAATELYGSCSEELVATTNAWAAVGVGGKATTGPVSVEGLDVNSSNYCSTATLEYSIYNSTLNRNAGATYLWSLTGSGAKLRFGVRGERVIVGVSDVNANFELHLTVTSTGCGSIQYSSGPLTVDYYQSNCSPYFAMYPNPANSEVTVSLKETNANESLTPEKEYKVQLYDHTGSLSKSGITKGRTLRLLLADLPNGLYFLHATCGEEQIQRQLSIQHD